MSACQENLPTLKELEDTIRAGDPQEDPRSESFMAQVVLLASISYGPILPRLQKLTGYPRSMMSKFNRNLRDSGIWRHGHVYADWSDKENGYCAFMLDVLVATGMMKRSA